MVGSAPNRPKRFPVVWNVFQRRNIHFVGRKQNIQDIEQALSQPKPKPQILAGGGGSGKTSLAVEYAYSHQESYDIVWWIRAETQATIVSDLAALAQRLARSGQTFDGPRQACNAALEQLRSRERWLLIFDNARRPEDILPFLPTQGMRDTLGERPLTLPSPRVQGEGRSGKSREMLQAVSGASAHAGGHVLVTSLNAHWQPLGQIQPVNSWLREESIEFVRERIGGIDDVHAAAQLCAALGDLPLALEQAAACMTQADLSLHQYLIDYEALWAEMLGRGRPAGSYPVYVAMTWELSFRRVESLNPMAAELLTLCGYFSPDEIPLAMIEDGSAELPHEFAFSLLNRATRGEALNLLERFSLIKTGDDSVSIHGVIAAMAQDRLDATRRQHWATIALRIASRAFPFDSQNPNSWRPCAAVLPHVLSSTMHAQSAGVVPHEVVDLLSRVGRFLMKQGSYTESRTLLEMANTLVRTTYGPRSVQAADIANNLARVRHRLGDLAGASTLYELALEIDRKNYGPDDPHMATIANNSAMTLVELGKLPQARQRFEWAIQVYRKAYVKNHPKVASVMNNLGFVLIQLKDYNTAREWLEQSLTITESTFGANHPQVACIAVNLGGALRVLGKHAPARKLFDRALLIDETAFGPHHPAVARDLLNLAQLLSDEQNFDEAVRHLERALAITESSFGSEHRETMLCLKELGRALKGAGDVTRAVDCMMRANTILTKPPRLRSSETVVGDEGMLA